MALHAENCVQGCFVLLDGETCRGHLCKRSVPGVLRTSLLLPSHFWALTIVPELLSQSKNVKNILKNCSFFVTFL